MPTLEDYASDPDDMVLDLPPPSAPAPGGGATYKGKGPALPAVDDMGHDGGGSIPKALRVAPDGQFVKPLNDEYTK